MPILLLTLLLLPKQSRSILVSRSELGPLGRGARLELLSRRLPLAQAGAFVLGNLTREVIAATVARDGARSQGDRGAGTGAEERGCGGIFGLCGGTFGLRSRGRFGEEVAELGIVHRC